MDEKGRLEGLAATTYQAPTPRRGINWELLNRLRTIAILKVGYAGVVGIPLLALVIVKWNDLFPSARIDLPLHFFLLFVGSLFLSCASLLCELFCPPLIREYGGLEKYRLEIARSIESHSVITKAAVLTRQTVTEQDLDKLGVQNKEARDLFLKSMASIEGLLPAEKKIGEDLFDGVAHYAERWDKDNNWGASVRYLTFGLYILAGLCLLAPIFRYLWYVTCAAFVCPCWLTP